VADPRVVDVGAGDLGVGGLERQLEALVTA
jgi:hypothetical protein